MTFVKAGSVTDNMVGSSKTNVFLRCHGDDVIGHGFCSNKRAIMWRPPGTIP